MLKLCKAKPAVDSGYIAVNGPAVWRKLTYVTRDSIVLCGLAVRLFFFILSLAVSVNCCTVTFRFMIVYFSVELNTFHSAYFIIWIPICVSCMLIHSHWGFVFRSSAAQKANVEYIVRAPGFSTRVSPHLGSATLRAYCYSRVWMVGCVVLEQCLYSWMSDAKPLLYV
jgi:hypothetical protein